MAKLIYSAIASLDGYVADEHGSFDWAVPDEEVHRYLLVSHAQRYARSLSRHQHLLAQSRSCAGALPVARCHEVSDGHPPTLHR